MLQCVSYHRCLLHFLHKALCFWHFLSPKVWRLTKLGQSYLHFLFKVMTKDTGEQPDEEMHTVRHGKRWSFQALGSALLLFSPVHPPGSSLTPFWGSFWVFTEAPLHGHDCLNHGPLMTDSASSPCSPPRGQGSGAERSISLITMKQEGRVQGKL